MSKIRVLLDPEQRIKYLDEILAMDGLGHISEDENAAYCTISLTCTPEELKPVLKQRQTLLMQRVLEKNGLKAYDPYSAPYSPDTNLTSRPDEVYAVDSGKIVGARYFVGHNILPSTGQGVEQEKAKNLLRVPVILMDKNIRMSRMQTNRTIYLQYKNFEKQVEEFVPVFDLLKQFEPGIGFNGETPVLLGFEKGSSLIVDLEKLVYSTFPDLKYEYDGKASIVRLRAENPESFYELREG